MTTKPKMLSESPKFKELWDAVLSACYKLNHPDMGGENYHAGKRDLNTARNLLPEVQTELTRLREENEGLRRAATELLVYVRVKHNIKHGEPFSCSYMNALDAALDEKGDK